MLKFGQKEVTTKDFFGQRQITDIFTIDVNKVVVSDKVPCNNGKDCRYIVGYQADGALVPLFIKTPKNIFSYGVSQYDKNSAYTMSFNVSEEKEWVSQYKKIWNEVESQLFEKMATEPIKREGRYVYGKLKMWKERMQWLRYRLILSTNKLKIIILRYMLKSVNAENQQCSMLSDDEDDDDDDDDDDDGVFEV